MDNRERDGRVELAAAFRLAVRCGFHEGVCNHFSLALSDDGRQFLVNPHGRHFSELRARDLLRVDVDGRVLAGDGAVEASALYIHGRMHVAKLVRMGCDRETRKKPFSTRLTPTRGARQDQAQDRTLSHFEPTSQNHPKRSSRKV